MIINQGVTLGKGLQVGESAISFPTYTVTASKLTMTETNDSVVFTVNTTSVLDGTMLFWSLSGSFLTNQIAVSSGMVKITSGTGTITVKTIPNGLANGTRDFSLSICEGSPQGTVLVTSSKINISDTSNPTTGQATYTTPGSYTFTVPNNVYYVNVLCVGGGGSGAYNIGKRGGGAGGGLGWKNFIPVIPGQQIPVVVGNGGAGVSGVVTGVAGNNGGDSYFMDTSTVAGFGGGGGTSTGLVAQGGSYVGDGGGNGGNGGIDTTTQNEGQGAGGGGAGGYTGTGGTGGNSQGNQSPPAQPTNGQGGGGAGGGATWGTFNGNGNAQSAGAGGGGVGIYGKGPDGVATPTTSNYVAGIGGGAGSGGVGTGATAGGNGTANFAASETSGAGGYYGGGSGGSSGAGMSLNPTNYVSAGRNGAVRIIWGPGRVWPSTLTTDQPVVL